MSNIGTNIEGNTALKEENINQTVSDPESIRLGLIGKRTFDPDYGERMNKKGSYFIIDNIKFSKYGNFMEYNNRKMNQERSYDNNNYKKETFQVYSINKV